MTAQDKAAFTATVAGVPRIGPHRELKKALETYWKDGSDANAQALAETTKNLTRDYAQNLANHGIDSVPTNGRSFYDLMLDTSALLGVLPERFDNIADNSTEGLPPHVDRLFATARGTADQPAAAMTKWFDTNYHYLIPELAGDTQFELHPEALLAGLDADIAEVAGGAEKLRPALIGPVTYLRLAKVKPGAEATDLVAALLEGVVAKYEELLPQLAAKGVKWVQFDEPILAADVTADDEKAIRETYTRLAKAAADAGLKLLVQSFFGSGEATLKALSGTGVAAIGIDLVTHGADVDKLEWSGEELLLAGVVNGRNVWRTDLDAALQTLKKLAERGPVAVSTSCSLLHVPYRLGRDERGEELPAGDIAGTDPTTTTEPDVPQEVRARLAFGAEKIQEVGVLSRLLNGTATADDEAFVEKTREVLATPLTDVNEEVQKRTAAVTDADRHRTPFEDRQRPEGLPQLPTTTIGSFPQTAEIRKARAALRKGEIDQAAYEEAMANTIREVIKEQEDLDLDVLVHGEAERNDMVQYFSEQLEGCYSTHLAWVQSYGSRCVRPPIIVSDVYRPEPMTLKWFKIAQDATDRPVKGMLTGPVTILAWSFVREDQPLSVTADQVALALRDEIDDLIEGGAKYIQVDEPAIRELLPLRKSEQDAYLQWAADSFRLATGSAGDDVQIHTHMCYSQFNELVDTIIDLDADCTTIESARAGMTVLSALRDAGFNLEVGPGVWDIHSPRVPSEEEITQLLRDAVKAVGPELLWANPDCGLKTRGWDETRESIKNLVAAAKTVRAEL